MRLVIAIIFALGALGCEKHDMDMGGVTEEVLKRKEGVRIEIDPVQEQK